MLDIWRIVITIAVVIIIFAGLYKLSPKLKLFFKEGERTEVQNERTLYIIASLTVIVYIITLVVIFPIALKNDLLNGVLLVFVVAILTSLSLFGQSLIIRNYKKGDEGSKELMSLGVTLTALGIESMIGSIIVAILLK